MLALVQLHALMQLQLALALWHALVQPAALLLQLVLEATRFICACHALVQYGLTSEDY
jgi:hypothetical protein